MGKKKFIDKKSAATFALMFKESTSSDDAGQRIFVRTDGGSGHVAGFSEEEEGGRYGPTAGGYSEGPLDPLEEGEDEYSEEEGGEEEEEYGAGNWWEPSRKPLPEHTRREILELGLPDDGYDYTQHLRVIGQGGATSADLSSFIPAPGPVAAVAPDVKVLDCSGVDSARLARQLAAQDADGPPSLSVMASISRKAKEMPFLAQKRQKLRGKDPHVPALNSEAEQVAAGGAEMSGPHAGETGAAVEEDADVAEEDDLVEMMRELESAEGTQSGPDGEWGLDDDFVLRANAHGSEDEGVENSPSEEQGSSRRKRPSHTARDGPTSREMGMAEGAAVSGVGMTGWQTGGTTAFDEDEEAPDLVSMDANMEASLREARVLDEQFEQLAIREYGGVRPGTAALMEEDVAERQEGQDPRFRGTASLAQFGHVLDEFLQEQREEQELLGQYGRGGVQKRGVSQDYQEAAELSNGLPGVLQAGGARPEVGSEGGEDGGGPSTAELKRDVLKFVEIQMREEEGQGEEKETVLLDSEDEDEQEHWDCESIVSTYSNLDNHPGRIGAPGANRKRTGGAAPAVDLAGGASAVTLAGKHQMPTDFGAGPAGRGGKGGKVHGDKGGQKASATQVPVRRKDETPEEKKARKDLVKESKAAARAAKKDLKKAYQSEAVRAQKGAASVVVQGVRLQ